MNVPRRTETGDAPVWQGATKEHTGSIRPRSKVEAQLRSFVAAVDRVGLGQPGGHVLIEIVERFRPEIVDLMAR